VAWSWVGVLHSSNEPGELSQWLCHDDSTINIVLDIIIIIIIIALYGSVWSCIALHCRPYCGCIDQVYHASSQPDVSMSDFIIIITNTYLEK